MKKLFALVFLLFFINANNCLAEEVPSDFYCVSEFEDMQENTADCYYANFLKFNGIINGFSDNTNRLEAEVTREQLAKYVSNAFGLTLPSDFDFESIEQFNDFDENNMFYKYIYSLRYHGIIEGYTDNTFRPSESVTFEQATKYIANAMEHKDKNIFNTDTFENYSDVDENNKFYDFFKKLYSNSQNKDYFDRLIDTQTEEINPGRPLLRSDFGKMVANAIFETKSTNNRNLYPLSESISGIREDEEKNGDNASLKFFEDLDVSMVETSGQFEFLFRQNFPKDLTETSEENNFEFAINGSYFGRFRHTSPLSEFYDPSRTYVIVEGTESSLNVRSDTSISDNIIGKLYDRDIVELKGRSTDWFKVLTVNGLGWIHKDFSRVVDLNETIEHNQYAHAGWLNYYGKYLFPLKTPKEDSQVTHVVRYDLDRNKVSIHEANSFRPKAEGSTDYLEFQTGPFMIEGNHILKENIENSRNGMIRRERTILVLANNGRDKYFVTARKPMNLFELSHYILYMKEFKGKDIDVIALDGGSSTQFYSKDYGEYNFYPGKALPIVIGIK